ncbi:hypothetical protein BKX93_10620 [Chromobacterium vaccinii]|uniref:Uncharacterized protein n=1 Tax=Chromobacterium vaccinii TaxID=1108595 RepID=A0A1D9LGK9_9NEIS|nr:hypothetical protein BKX93_10620 [Chromobacterium vaccinii]
MQCKFKHPFPTRLHIATDQREIFCSFCYFSFNESTNLLYGVWDFLRTRSIWYFTSTCKRLSISQKQVALSHLYFLHYFL